MRWLPSAVFQVLTFYVQTTLASAFVALPCRSTRFYQAIHLSYKARDTTVTVLSYEERDTTGNAREASALLS